MLAWALTFCGHPGTGLFWLTQVQSDTATGCCCDLHTYSLSPHLCCHSECVEVTGCSHTLACTPVDGQVGRKFRQPWITYYHRLMCLWLFDDTKLLSWPEWTDVLGLSHLIYRSLNDMVFVLLHEYLAEKCKMVWLHITTSPPGVQWF